MARYVFNEQFGCVCIVINETCDTAESVINEAYGNDATFFDGEDTCLCVKFPDRPQELYTEDAIKRTFAQKALKKASAAPSGNASAAIERERR